MAVRFSEIHEGMVIYDVAGDKIGNADELGDNYVGVHTGFLGLGKHFYIPISAIREMRSDELHLNIAKDELSSAGFDQPPTDMGTRDMYTREDSPMNRETPEFPDTAMATGTDTGEYHPREGYQDQGGRMQLRVEELQARMEAVEAGTVWLEKDGKTEERTMEVPVTHEEVVVDRRPVDRRPADQPIDEDDEETIDVPVMREEVTVEKRPVVYEEVEVGKRAVQDTRQVSGTVRREEARIDHDGDVEVPDRP